MAEIIRMPKMSDTMTEGVIASWLVKEGDTIESGDIIAEVETDKATMELDNYVDGILLHIGPKEGDAIPVDGIIAIVGEKGEDISALLNEAQNGKASAPAESPKAAEAPVEETPAPMVEAINTSGINAQVITMPKMSDTMTEGVIANWLVKVGDQVESGDILAEVETDKATMELENYEDGEILYIGVEAGGSIAVDGVIAVVGEKGADFETLLKAAEAKKTIGNNPEPQTLKVTETPAPKAAEAPKTSAPIQVKAPAPKGPNGRILASPLAKKMATDKGIAIHLIPGSGEGGRIIKRDVENYVPQATTSAASTVAVVSGQESTTEIKLSQMRKAIVRTVANSKFSAPHFYVTMEINMDNCMKARKSINEIAPVKISFNDIIIKAVASSLRKHPAVNVSWENDKMYQNDHIHIGVAAAIEDGLVIPVIKFADNKQLSNISSEVKDLVKKAQSKKLSPDLMTGSTFTISNLGMFGVEEFTAIVNLPAACILAVGGIKQVPVVKDGQIVPGNTMKVTLSCDHRAVDGAIGAAFLKTLKETLEDPIRILV